MGKTSWEIAQILRISKSTVEFHLAHAGKQLNTFGRWSTCLEALRRGLIDI
jgi:DNA-binding CsgD family transcriptional regulator